MQSKRTVTVQEDAEHIATNVHNIRLRNGKETTAFDLSSVLM